MGCKKKKISCNLVTLLNLRNKEKLSADFHCMTSYQKLNLFIFIHEAFFFFAA